MDKYFEEFLCSIMIGYIAISLNIEVFNRYFLNSPSAYTDEIARTLMIMLIFLGVPWAVKLNKHVVIDLIPTSEKWRSRRVYIELISHLIFIVFSILFALASYRAAEFHHMLGSVTEGLGLPYWLLLGTLPGVFVLTVFRLLQRIYVLLKNRNVATPQEPLNV